MDDHRPERRRLRIRRVLAIMLVLGSLGEAARRSSPTVCREWGLHLANRAINAGRLDDAEARLDALISAYPRETRPRLILVDLYLRGGRITEAEEALQRAVELGASLTEARREHELIRQLMSQPSENSLAVGPS